MVEITRMYLVRNGGASVRKPGQFVGQLDLPLSREGEERVKRLLDVFRDEKIDRIYTSALKRASQSAAIFSEFYDLDEGVRDDLKEIHLGEFEGRTFEEISKESPALAREMSARPVQFKYPGGESFLELAERAHRAFWEIVEKSEGKNIVVFSHGGVNRTIVATLLGMKPEGMFKIEQDPAAISLVEVINRFPRIRFLNVTVR